MRTLKGSRTEKNLLTAFAGESQARNRYTYFAGQAKKDAPQSCPACAHPRDYYEILGED
jgi:rubrerythrin